MAKPAAKRKIAIVAAEMTPYAKVGGLADVIGSLPLALAAEGAEVCVVLPGYRSALQKLRSGNPVGKKMSVAVGPEPQPFSVRRGMHGDVSVYLIDHPRLLRPRRRLRRAPRLSGQLSAFRIFRTRSGKILAELVQPNVVHAHDWHCAVSPIAIRADPAMRERFARTATLFTIHNMAFQGIYDQAEFALLNLDSSFFSVDCLEFHGRVNLMKGAVVLADAASTVSPTYAREVINHPELGFGSKEFCGPKVSASWAS